MTKVVFSYLPETKEHYINSPTGLHRLGVKCLTMIVHEKIPFSVIAQMSSLSLQHFRYEVLTNLKISAQMFNNSTESDTSFRFNPYLRCKFSVLTEICYVHQ